MAFPQVRYCTNNCVSGCVGYCGTSCSRGCGSGANQDQERIEELANTFNCTDCMGTCTASCAQCEGSCKDGCQESCNTLCNAGCEDEEKKIPELKRVMDAENIKELFDFLVYEAEVRRNQVVETEWEDTIRMIALVMQIGQTFLSENAFSMWDVNQNMNLGGELQRLAASRTFKINKNQTLNQSLTYGEIVTTDKLMRLLTLTPVETDYPLAPTINQSKTALLNDILFNKAQLTIENYNLAMSGEYVSVIEKTGGLYTMEINTAKPSEIYSILMTLYIIYNGQEGLSHKIFKILKNERARLYGNLNIISNKTLLDLLTIKDYDSKSIIKNKQAFISEVLYYHFSPTLFYSTKDTYVGSCRIRKKGLEDNLEDIPMYSNDYRDNQVIYSIGVFSNQYKGAKHYYLPYLIPFNSNILSRLKYYYYLIQGNKITKILYTENLLSDNPQGLLGADIEKIENGIIPWTKDNLLKEKFEEDINKYGFEPYDNYKNLIKMNLKQQIFYSESSAKSILNNEKFKGNFDYETIETNPIYINLQSDKEIKDQNFNLPEKAQIKIKELSQIAQRMLLYYFQYGRFTDPNSKERKKIDNLKQAYPYYIQLKEKYDEKFSELIFLSELTDKQKNSIKKQFIETSQELEKYFDNTAAQYLFDILIVGIDQLINRSKIYSDDPYTTQAVIDGIDFENIHLEEEQRDYLKNPKGGRYGFQYEIYSAIMAALVKIHGNIVLYAEEKNNQINPYNQLFQLVAEERIKILGEKDTNPKTNPAYDSNLAYSKLLNHKIENFENLEGHIRWHGFISASEGSVTSGNPDPDWRYLDFNLYGSYFAPTEWVINALNFYNINNKINPYNIDLDTLAYNKNVLFTDITYSVFDRIICLFTPYNFSRKNTLMVLDLNTFKLNFKNALNSNQEFNPNNLLSSEIFKNLIHENIQNPIFNQIIVLKDIEGTYKDVYAIYKKNNDNIFTWEVYNFQGNLNLETDKLIPKTYTYPKDFGHAGTLGIKYKDIIIIPDSYKEIIENLENYNANNDNSISIIKNEVPMIFEDIFKNVFQDDLKELQEDLEIYQSGTLHLAKKSLVLTKTLGPNYNGEDISSEKYDYLKSQDIKVEDYFIPKETNSVGKISSYTFTPPTGKNLLNFFEEYHQNGYQINKEIINELSEFDNQEVNEKRSLSSLIFNSAKGAQKWFEIAEKLNKQMIPVYDRTL